MESHELLTPLQEKSPNKMNRSPPNRRSSLGFEIVSIPTSTNFETKIPQPPQQQESFQSRILSMQQRLARKPPPSTSYQVSSYQHPNFTTELQNTIYNITEEISKKQEQIDHYDIELNKLRQIHRNYQKKVSDINSEFINFQAQFDYFSEEIIKSVENEEKLIEIKLKENQSKLDNQFKEIEFEMLNELNEVKNFDYFGLITKFESLEKLENDLSLEVQKKQFKVNEEIEVETTCIKNDYEKKVISLKEELTKSDEILHQKQVEFDSLNNSFQKELDDLDVYNSKIESTKQQITTIEQSMTNFHEVKNNMIININQLDQELNIKSQQSNLEQKEYDEIQSEYQNLHSKIQKHDEHRRILENSIMDYENKIRIYGISNQEEPIDKITKIFKYDTPSSFIIDEFLLFVANVFKGINVSILTQFISGKSIILQSLQGLVHQNIKLEYQCINETNDLLTNSSLPKDSLFSSQRMIIDDITQFESIINGIESTGLVIHILTINGTRNSKSFESKLVVLDTSQLDANSQISILNKLASNNFKIGSSLDQLIQWISIKSKKLIISELQNQDILNALKSLN
ncbi:hypothetical protein KGF54_002997 [Candida jiufengensis]|uniref:uncharacterized protein n=1 Tax=Candida jiufengensis TaxID=497108 RepID=UPI002224B412|nr:uncharacterized protein KGF54_002997 [Candida jiufengensis]KAI5953625.1 hypothetical protein KGF54_002997 [Candida jiufengensis]